MKRILFLMPLFIVVATVAYFRGSQVNQVNELPKEVSTLTIFSTSKPEHKSLVLLDVPFATQAPFGEWDDPRFQDGCEEASSLMAAVWAKKERKITPAEAKEEIIKISAYQTEKYGEYRDTSASDTLERIIKGYFGYQNAELGDLTSSQEIIRELEKGNVVIVPMNGQALGNPNFKAPGPERHMVVVIGYDAKNFITNDPGTKRGAKHEYGQDKFFSAIRDFPSGYHESIEKVEKRMIVVRPGW